jgi:hypothetical protein
MIFGALAPSGAGVAAAAHELLDHGPFTGIDAVTLAALFHGHRHSTGAPDHDHTLVAPSPSGKSVYSGLALQSGCLFDTVARAPDLVTVSLALERPVLAMGSGPPPGISPLRV